MKSAEEQLESFHERQDNKELQEIINVWRYQHFTCFARNARWGVCGNCPNNITGLYPEFCVNTERYDHQLTLEQLVDSYTRRIT